MGRVDLPEQLNPIGGAAHSESVLTGPAAGIGAFGIWALFPIYFNQFGTEVSPWEILLHRMIWASAFLLIIVLLTRRLDSLRGLIKRPKALMALGGSALAITVNWGTFIWAVNHGQILQSSLGYYINPLLNVFLGYCFLGERLHPLQRLAVGIAAGGVVIALVGYGRMPWLALIMAASFGLYGLIRKQVEVDSVTGLLIETLLLLPFAAAWLISMHVRDQTVFLQAGRYIDGLLIGAGLVTIVPLMLFAVAARRLRLATLGILQYIAPTGHFLIGVFLYGEIFTAADAVTFGCIWVGLFLYTTDMWMHHRKHLRLQ
ncbi:MAG: EamA family transporter RarD [Desulfatitalea sp.]|nr:EamA family transporter RarD [Desulfatitalea sp.]